MNFVKAEPAYIQNISGINDNLFMTELSHSCFLVVVENFTDVSINFTFASDALFAELFLVQTSQIGEKSISRYYLWAQKYASFPNNKHLWKAGTKFYLNNDKAPTIPLPVTLTAFYLENT